MKRASGILCHITSLPSKYGIGSFGKACRDFADQLKKCGCHYWQVLPFVPSDAFNSPYRSDSAFAGNTDFIDLEDLRDRDLITNEELESCIVEDGWKVDFNKVHEDRERIYRLAYERMSQAMREDVIRYAKNNEWLQDYALFKAIESDIKKPWSEWPEQYKNRDPEAIENAKQLLEREIVYVEFLQYLFYEQWAKSKEYINSQGIEIIGDIPMYVDYESVDVWANKEIFQLEDDKPTRVAGVPPDFFSEDGQLWGNPLYDWKRMRQNNYSWWIDRIGHSLQIYDMLRIDHFRAFASYFAIPADASTAKVGVWEKGPGLHFFEVLNQNFKDPNLIAEDLGGDSDQDVQELLRQTGIPGMRVTEMAFISYDESTHFPFNYVNNSVCYLGTHDNNTILGWLKEELNPDQRKYALEYFDFDEPGDNWQAGGPNSKVTHKFIRGIFESGGGITIIQLQDVLGLGSDCRMNKPGTTHGNWEFKVPQYYLNELNTEWMAYLNGVYKRVM